ncbi:MAG TPA: phosphatase PAP2 family protein [Mycobacteriales bacterium]|nr:phosphatase PAP2 family protein [Mycobacteriales bacterium]
MSVDVPARPVGAAADAEGPTATQLARATALVEIGVVVGLFLLWRTLGTIAGHHTTGAVAHGRSVWDVEQDLHLPSEVALQRRVLPHTGLVRALDIYYVAAHVGGMAVFAIWMWVRHRASYRRWRRAIVLFTGVAFLVQLWPVAPPRLVPGLGFVDTARLYHQSVYPAQTDHGLADQVSSMPSVHVGWAILVAVAVIAVSRGPWRWLAVLHPLLTMTAVVVTANHFWLDGIVAGALVAVAVVTTGRHRERASGPFRHGKERARLRG